MKHIHKFLYACFSFIVNTFYNPNSAFAGWVVSLVTYNTSCLASSCEENISSFLFLVRGKVNHIMQKIKSCKDTDCIVSTCQSNSGCNTKICSDTEYVKKCTINGISNSENCINSHIITDMACADCPDDGIVANSPVFITIENKGVWLCSTNSIVTTDDSGGLSYNEDSEACRKYDIYYYYLINNIPLTLCHKTTNKTYTDEKGEFSYTDTCYINEE